MPWRGRSQPPLVTKFWCAPGNAGIAKEAECVALDVADHAAVIDFCKTNKVALVVVGPETPLAAGIVDDLTAAGIKAFGPSKVAAQLESSKGSPRRSAPNSAFRPVPMSDSPTPMTRAPMSRARARRSW